MATVRLYEEDSGVSRFKARVIDIFEEQGQLKVVLDQTAFFPEGGGQSADTGTIAGVQVQDVQMEEGIIYHFVDGRLSKGAEVEGILDWKKRFIKMQQHTGEHIVSGLIHSTYGMKNVGYHLGSVDSTMDFNGILTQEQLRQIENEANEVVYQDLPVEVIYPSADELGSFDYRSKIEIEGQLRLVKIGSYDLCACCAPHLSSTGSIGAIKLTDVKRYKGGVRVTMLCGSRAMVDYQNKEKDVKTISEALSAKEDKVADAVERLIAERDRLREMIREQQKQLLSYRVKEIDPTDEVVYTFEAGLDANGARELVNLIVVNGAQCAMVMFGDESDEYKYVLGSSGADIRLVGKQLNEQFEGRGGGQARMVQGMIKGERTDIEDYIKTKLF